MKRVIIHPGYPKTGSTTLQGTVFPDLCRAHGWYYFGKEYAADGSSATTQLVRQFLRAFPHWDEIYIQHNRDRILADYELFDTSTIFVSLEELILRSLKGDVTEDGPVCDDLFAAFRKLKALFSSADEIQVILTIRRQRELVPSLYAQGYNHFFRRIPGTKTIESYLSHLSPDSSYPRLFSPLYYAAAVAELRNIFGTESVLVLPFELLRDEPDTFFGRLGAFLGQPYEPQEMRRLNTRRVGSGWKSRNVTLLAGLRRLKKRLGIRGSLPKKMQPRITGALRNVSLRKPREITISEEQQRLIDQVFAASNTQLDRMIDSDLGKWEYY